MTKYLVAVGEMLGGTPYGDTLKFFVKFGEEEIELDAPVYNVWQAIKMTLNSREEMVSLMKKSLLDINVNAAIDKLIQEQLVIEWKEQYDDSYFEQFALVPKGRVQEIKEDDYIVVAFPKAEPVNLSMMSYFLWRHAHPFLSCNSTLLSIHQTTGVGMDYIKNDFIRWVPILVNYDLLAIVPNN